MTPTRTRQRRDTPGNRATFGVYIDSDVNLSIQKLVQMRVLPNRSAAVEEGLRILIAMHADKLKEAA